MKKWVLKSHVKATHSNSHEKSYNCDLCKIYFIQVGNWEKHMLEVHVNMKPAKWQKPLLPGPLVYINDIKKTNLNVQ